jgi:uncharacterized protein YcfJ
VRANVVDAEPVVNGLRCPRCHCPDSRVTNSYPLPNGTKRRRRECRHCQRSFFTVEVPSVDAAKSGPQRINDY